MEEMGASGMIGLGLVALSVKETLVPWLSEDWSRNRWCSRWQDRPVRRPHDQPRPVTPHPGSGSVDR